MRTSASCLVHMLHHEAALCSHVAMAEHVVRRRDDLWFLSSTAAFKGRHPGEIGGRLAMPWLAVARSLWHGPNRDGKYGPVRQ